jgi:hypothetical protein
LVNALIHRDYFVSAVTRIFIFDNRIEIISPGHLPNNLTIEKIRAGNSNIRNPILASFAAKKLFPTGDWDQALGGQLPNGKILILSMTGKGVPLL